MEGFSATITSIGTLVAATGALITAIGAFVLAYRSSRRAEEKRAKDAAAVEDARRKAADAALESAIAAAAAEDAKKAIIKVGDDVFLLGKAVDGRLTQLIEEIRKSSFAEGRLEGVAARKATEGDS